MMKRVKKIVAGLLLLWGLPISIWATVETFHPQTPANDRDGAMAALILFGLPPIAISSWLLYSLHQQHQAAMQQQESALEQLFLQLLEEHQGVIHPILFATKADLPLAQAKAYLDEKAVLLNALYEATDAGGVVYRFPY